MIVLQFIYGGIAAVLWPIAMRRLAPSLVEESTDRFLVWLEWAGVGLAGLLFAVLWPVFAVFSALGWIARAALAGVPDA